MHKNVLGQLVTPGLSIEKPTICMRCLLKPFLRDVTYGTIRGRCISIRIPPEEEDHQSPVFAGQVIRNFECIIEP